MKLVVQEMSVRAPAHLVYQMLTDPTLFVQWMAVDATLDPRAGGIVRWDLSSTAPHPVRIR